LQYAADQLALLSCFNRSIVPNRSIKGRGLNFTLGESEERLRKLIKPVLEEANTLSERGDHLPFSIGRPCQILIDELVRNQRNLVGAERTNEDLKDFAAMEALQENIVRLGSSLIQDREVRNLAILYINWAWRVFSLVEKERDLAQSTLAFRRATGLDSLPLYECFYHFWPEVAEIHDDHHPLFIAAELNAPNLASRAMRNAQNIHCKTSSGKTSLIIAAQFGSLNVLQILVDANSPLNESDDNNLTALHYAAMYGYTKCVSRLAQARDIQYTKDISGKTALHLAVLHLRQRTAKLLLDYGAQIDAQINDGSTALHLLASAATAGVPSCTDEVAKGSEMMKLLLTNGSDINSVDKLGRTALHKAVGRGYNHTVQVLLQHKANLSIQDCNGVTALHLAVFFMHFDVAKLLLEHGAPVDIPDEHGQTALRVVAADEYKDLASDGTR
ncbi:MAG: hypothetical protein Q9214_007301, partial [Letrouitia sp. 1 TL-2023]